MTADRAHALKIMVSVLECCIDSGLVPETTVMEMVMAEFPLRITVRQALDMAEKALELEQ